MSLGLTHKQFVHRFLISKTYFLYHGSNSYGLCVQMFAYLIVQGNETFDKFLMKYYSHIVSTPTNTKAKKFPREEIRKLFDNLKRINYN